MFDSFEVGKVLVIAPLRVAKTVWPEERKNWEHTSFLQMSVMVGSAKQRETALHAAADVYVINRENVKWLIDYLAKHKMPWPFDMVVIDELSSFKNHQSQRWKALRKVRPHIKRIVGLTGTPAGNGLMDLWAETALIDGGSRLGRFIGRYRETYFKATGMNPYTGVVFNYVPLPGAQEAIYDKISDITVSMKALERLKMPEQVMVNHYVDMDTDEQEAYDRMKNELLLQMDGDTIDAANAAVLSGKLQQMANGAAYSDSDRIVEIHQRKLDALEDIIESANGRPLLVAYWFKHDLERIKKRFDVREIKSSQDIADWNEGKIPVAVIHPASAGHGLNLQRGGNYLVWFGLTWSLELYQQTNARLWRQGQSSDTVVIQHIVTRGTIDERILKALSEKDSTQAALIGAVRANL